MRRRWHQHQRRLQHHRPGDRHPLLLTAGELAGQLVDVLGQLDQPHALLGAAADLRPRQPLHLQAEGDVAAHRHVREQRVALEHHPEPALLRRQRVDPALVLPDAAGGQREQAGQAVQRAVGETARASPPTPTISSPMPSRTIASGPIRSVSTAPAPLAAKLPRASASSSSPVWKAV